MERSNRDMPELINFLRANNYRLDSVSFNPRFRGTTTAKFSKMANIDDINGNDVNDASIDITVDFDSRFDYRNAIIAEDGEVVYNDLTQVDREQFVNQLWNRTYDNSAPVVPQVVPQVPQGAPTNGGKRKGRKTKRRTIKNRRK